MQCPECNHIPLAGNQPDPTRCSECGIFYAKAIEMRRAQQQQAKLLAQQQAAPPPPRLGYLYCPSCGSTGSGQTHTKGSIFIELVLWLCFLVPGLIYSIWRLSTRQKVCQKCSNPGLIPTNSPKAKKELGLG